MNACFRSHGYCVLGSNRGFLDPSEKPTIESGNESFVATPATFNGYEIEESPEAWQCVRGRSVIFGWRLI